MEGHSTEYEDVTPDKLKILSVDDLILGINDDSTYDTHYVEFDSKLAQQYIEIYKERFQKYKVKSKSLKR